MTVRWLEHLAELARLALLPGQRLTAVVARCEECDPIQVIPTVFIPGVDFWKP